MKSLKKIGLKSLLFLFLLVFFALDLKANDSEFFGDGEELIPLENTTISLKKEVLKIKYDEGLKGQSQDEFLVDVTYELNNLGSEKETIVGFIAPPVGEDYQSKEGEFYLYGFTVEMNGAKLPYEIKLLGKTEFRVSDSKYNGSDYVYYFKAKFKQGKNIIRHTYKVPAANSNDYGVSFAYRLTNAKRWANQQIDDFTLIIDGGPKGAHGGGEYYWVQQTFWKNNKNIDWKVEGKGKISSSDMTKAWSWDTYNFPSIINRVRILEGNLKFHAVNFKPDYDFVMGQDDRAMIQTIDHDRYPLINNLQKFIWPDDFIEKGVLPQLTDQELRYYKNFLFAYHGVVFKDDELNKFFNRFNWYIPDAAVPLDVKILNQEEKQELDLILKEEERRVSKSK